MATDHIELREAVTKANEGQWEYCFDIKTIDLAELLAAYDALKAGATVKRGKKEYPAEFSAAYDAMRDAGARWREGSTPAAAYKQWQARIKAGADPEQVLMGTQRYAAYVKATASEVKMAQTFFGPGEHYTAEWATARAVGIRVGYAQPIADAKAQASAEAKRRLLGGRPDDDGRTIDMVQS